MQTWMLNSLVDDACRNLKEIILEGLETTGERCARVCYVGSWPCLSHMTFAKTFVRRN